MSRKIKMLVHSPSGRGKTTLAKTAVGDENLMPMLAIDFEGGMPFSIGSVCNPIDELENIKDSTPSVNMIDMYRIKHWNDFDDIYEYISSAENIYKSIFFDSLSEMAKFNLFEITGNYANAKKSLKSIRIPQIQDYGRTNTLIHFLVRTFRDLDMNVIFTAGSIYDDNPASGGKKMFPDMPGKLASQIPHVVPLVAYLARIEEENNKFTRALMFDSSNAYEAKAWDEYGLLGDCLENPTLPKLFKLINGIKD